MMLSVWATPLVTPCAAQAVETGLDTKTVRVPGTTVEFEMVRVPASSIEIEGELHEIPAMWVATEEVTWDLYDVYLYELDKPESERDSAKKGADATTRPSKPYVPPDRGLGHEGYPAMGMTIHAAEQFCNWLGESTGTRCRIPTKPEWVYLAGDASSEQSWTRDNADYTTHPVGEMPANSLGLHDMLGNVAEWVDTDERRPIAMGGSYKEPADECTPTSHMQQKSSWNASDPQIPKSKWWLADCSWVGFRFVIEIEEEGADDEHE
ncbi:MAG: formylglycine-generating enzyme family protein [Phycisphaerales bacterium JB061]